jgi:hypothetical protein
MWYNAKTPSPAKVLMRWVLRFLNVRKREVVTD